MYAFLLSIALVIVSASAADVILSASAADFNIADCAEFAVNAGTSVNFDGDVTKISGLVGVSPGTAIQGNYEFTDSIYDIQVLTIVLMYAYKYM
jgi:hypothetical protein